MKTADQSQDPLFIEENPLLSHLFLNIAVLSYLPLVEREFIEALWMRGARFGNSGFVHMSYSDYVNGNMPGAFPSRQFPQHPETTDRHFRRVRDRLIMLGLIERKGTYEYRISCYPRDFVDPKGTLRDSLAADITVTGYSILQRVAEVTASLRKFKTI